KVGLPAWSVPSSSATAPSPNSMDWMARVVSVRCWSNSASVNLLLLRMRAISRKPQYSSRTSGATNGVCASDISTIAIFPGLAARYHCAALRLHADGAERARQQTMRAAHHFGSEARKHLIRSIGGCNQQTNLRRVAAPLFDTTASSVDAEFGG